MGGGVCSSCQRLTNLRKKRLEDAINHLFSRVDGLDEPQAAKSDRLFACGEGHSQSSIRNVMIDQLRYYNENFC